MCSRDKVARMELSSCRSKLLECWKEQRNKGTKTPPSSRAEDWLAANKHPGTKYRGRLQRNTSQLHTFFINKHLLIRLQSQSVSASSFSRVSSLNQQGYVYLGVALHHTGANWTGPGEFYRPPAWGFINIRRSNSTGLLASAFVTWGPVA